MNSEKLFDGLTIDDIKLIFSNPFYCISKVDSSLFLEHEPLVSEEVWMQCAKKSIEEDGIDDFLIHLLRNLRGDYPKNVHPNK